MHSKQSEYILLSFKTLGLNLAVVPKVLNMFKTIEVHSYGIRSIRTAF